MKSVILINIFLTINIQLISSANNQKCYVCDPACDQPTAGDIQDCSEDGVDGTNGQTFVINSVPVTKNVSATYSSLATEFSSYLPVIGVNTSDVEWKDLIRWVCYVSKDKHRGCLKMAKSLCKKDDSILGKLQAATQKLEDILKQSASFAAELFTGQKTTLNDTQKQGITKWFIVDYMSKLVNSTAGPEYQLDSCCEGDQCNSGSILGISMTLMMIIFFYLI